ncbi:hypothetical protein LWI28_014981 [Acer negundo]|uniref:Uncharacterized protein n=1 Tax=Acer negundo TaxID=4023 RepID=A0AAD5IEB9_ACENE|nr:hypothetical protein LWI28_014981 [Acer negundo]
MAFGTISVYNNNTNFYLQLDNLQTIPSNVKTGSYRGRITYRSSGTCSSHVWKDSREVWYLINMLQGTFSNLACSIISIMGVIDKCSTHIWVSRNFIYYFISPQAISFPEAAERTVRTTREATHPRFIQEVGHTSSFREGQRRRGGLTANSDFTTTRGLDGYEWVSSLLILEWVVGMARATGK